MSDIDTELETEQDTDTDLVRNLRSQLRASNKERKETAEQAKVNEGAARRVAFLDAGLPDVPASGELTAEQRQLKYFRDHYDGEPTAEAIQQAASEAGFVSAQTEANNANAAEVQAQSQAMAGGEITGEGQDADFIRALDEASAKPGDVGSNIRRVYQQFGRPYGMGE